MSERNRGQSSVAAHQQLHRIIGATAANAMVREANGNDVQVRDVVIGAGLGKPDRHLTQDVSKRQLRGV